MKTFARLCEEIASKKKKNVDDGKIKAEVSGKCDPIEIRPKSDPMTSTYSTPAGMNRVN